MASTTSRYWYQEPFVWFLIAIPLSSVLVGMVMLWFAVDTDDGLVVDDYYKQGLAINKKLDRDVVARQYALDSTLRFVHAFDQIHVALNARDKFTYPTEIRLGLYHATRKGFDREMTLTRISDTGYSGPLPELTAGRWYVTLFHDHWRLIGVMVWPTELITLTFLQESKP